jgi:ribosome-associated protein
MHTHDNDPDFAPDERPSKTQQKKAMHELQSLGEALCRMPDEVVERLEIPETLRDAVCTYNRTRSHEGRRRQMQYIGKLMRSVDVTPIRDAIAAQQLGHAHDTLTLHRTEQWRAELIADDAALTRWMAEFPQTDLPRLRALIRNARKDAAASPEQRNGRAYRELFQFLKPILLEAGAGPQGTAAPDDMDDTP